jgi:cytochrome c heme-lyase
MSDKCPVDHGSSKATDQCPVDHTARSTWSGFLPKGPPKPTLSYGGSLSTDREMSSIPKADEGNWVYPSEAQFFAAMARKNHNPQAPDMRTIVPIHNAVNERAWGEVLKWEMGRGGDKCGGVKLVNFKGKPGQMSPKARWKSLLGYVFTLYLGI